MKISIIGCGHMGGAIAKVLAAKKIGAVRVSSPRRPAFRVTWTCDNRQAVKNADVVIVAVKSGVVMSVLQEISPELKSNQILISIAAGVPIKKLSLWSGGHKKIVRVMPNLPVQVLASVSVWMSTGLNSQEKSAVKNLLQSFGIEIEAKKENMIDAATAASGGGPAYVAAFLESVVNFTIKNGFSKEDARQLAISTLLGSGIYIDQTKTEFSDLKNAVQTKGGTTEAAFKILKVKKWQAVLEQALAAAHSRAQELGKM